MDQRIELLLQVLDQAYDKKAWHGTNLRGSLRGLTLNEVLWRPGKDRNCIWDVAVHCAYWKFCVRRHVTGDRSLQFPRNGSNWFPLPRPANAAAWKRDLELLRAEHLALRAAIESLSPSRLKQTPKGLKWRLEQYVYGAASHDLYHAGQIQLQKRLTRA
jgi:hypothetical protein